MAGKVFLIEHVVAVRSARNDQWVATVAGSSIYHSERIMGLLYQNVASSDFKARLHISYQPPQRNQDEGNVS